jgi:hypothetical protein
MDYVLRELAQLVGRALARRWLARDGAKLLAARPSAREVLQSGRAEGGDNERRPSAPSTCPSAESPPRASAAARSVSATPQSEPHSRELS